MPSSKEIEKTVTKDGLSQWFDVLQELDEFIGIRFGYQSPDGNEPVWQFLGHEKVDGIGGFARILRERGVDLTQLPRTSHRTKFRLFASLWRMPRYLFTSRDTLSWASDLKEPGASHRDESPKSVACHVFSATETQRIRYVSRRSGVTVNSFLLRHLDHAIRGDLSDPSSKLAWMIPVNLRGKMDRELDEDNHSSYVAVQLESQDNPKQVHSKIYTKLKAGEHWLTWFFYKLGRFFPSSMKKKLIDANRVTLIPTVGSFSNLGEWDGNCKWKGSNVEGAWFFCPPVLRCQMIGAGCVTFQNRLSLTIQVHPELSIDPDLTKTWIQRWKKEIEIDLI